MHLSIISNFSDRFGFLFVLLLLLHTNLTSVVAPTHKNIHISNIFNRNNLSHYLLAIFFLFAQAKRKNDVYFHIRTFTDPINNNENT